MYKGTNRGIKQKHSARSRVLAVVTAAATMVAMTLTPASVFADATQIVKEETVYVVTDSTGAQDEVIVSDHLENGIKIDEIEDKSNLSDIENVKGDETYENGTGSAINWKAKGKDIYYQGTTTREVPVTLNVTYTLDGKVVDAKDLEGQTGNLEIRIDYENHTSYNGIKVPFIVMSGFMVKDDCYTDITIDHGKIIDDGEKQVVVGFAAPGLAEDLGLSGEDIGMSDSVTIKGKANNFAVDDIMTFATSSIFDEVDLGDIDDLDFDDEIAALNRGSKQLVKGSKLLYEGIDKMQQNMPTLKEGVDALKEGADALNEGTKDAKEGATQLSNGLSQLSEQLPVLLQKLISGTLSLKHISSGVLNGLKNVKTVMDGAGSTPGLTGTLDSVTEQMTCEGGTIDDAQDVYEYLEKIAPLIEANKDKLAKKDPKYGELADQIGDVKSKAGQVVKDLKEESATVEEVNKNLKSISKSIGACDPDAGDSHQTTLIGNMTVLDNGLDNMSQILASKSDELNQGLSSLTEGAEQLATGETKLAKGAKQLANGMESLQTKSGKLIDGVSQLDSGALELSKGMAKLYNQGIKKIVDLYNGDLKDLTSGLSNMRDAAKDYKTFTLLPANMDGSTKFIYKTPITE